LARYVEWLERPVWRAVEAPATHTFSLTLLEHRGYKGITMRTLGAPHSWCSGETTDEERDQEGSKEGDEEGRQEGCEEEVSPFRFE
jgi:hypothetical protein